MQNTIVYTINKDQLIQIQKDRFNNNNRRQPNTKIMYINPILTTTNILNNISTCRPCH